MARTSPTTDTTSEAVENLRGRAYEQVDRVGEQAERLAAGVEQTVREMGDLVQQFRPAVERFLKEQPMTTRLWRVLQALASSARSGRAEP